MTITEFLEARIAEDEAMALRAEAVSSARWLENDSLLMFRDPGNPEHAEALAIVENYRFDAAWAHVARHDPARVLAECEAKRQAIWAAWDDHERIDHEWGWCRSMKEMDALGDAPGVVTAFAAVHDDHPDYNPAWRTR